MLDLLTQDLPVPLLLQRLNEDEAFATFRSYMQSFEPGMLEVAVQRVKK